MNKSEQRLNRIRQAFKIQDARGSESELARRLGVTPGALSNWKKRDSLPFSVCEKAAHETGQPLVWIIAEEDIPAYAVQPYPDESGLILDWLIDFLAAADPRDRAWLLIQMQHCIPPFREWLERRKREDQQ